jgi:hypothetical protein
MPRAKVQDLWIFRNYQIYFSTENSTENNYFKMQGLLCKRLRFSEIWNYFPKGNPIEYVHGP